ncbi:MAG: TonB-dependent receptor [Saprospiraceae bacterium]|nr:TonB-dependent receptor [Saprospiraceae bacterium]
MNSNSKHIKFITLTIIAAVMFLSFNSLAQTGTIRGVVYDKETGEPIIFTNVYLYKTTYGSSTDKNGLFVITKIPAGKYTLMLTYLGYDTIKMPVTVKDDEIIIKKLYAQPGSTNLPTFNVSAAAKEARTETVTSVIKVTPKQIKQLPTVGGQPDLVQYIQVLPGVNFTGDQGGQLYIRGGSPVQNKVLLDGAIIYNPFHSIGLFSVFETEIIRNAEIYTGGFNSEYGGRISSIMDITTRDGNKKQLSGMLGASPFGANVLLEGPLKKQTEGGKGSSSFILSMKNSFLKESSKIFYDYIDTAGLPFNYTDLYGKISFNSDNGSKVNFFGFNFGDKVNYKTLSDFHWIASGGGTNFVVIPAETSTIIDGNFAYSSYEIILETEGQTPKSSKVSGFNMGLNFTNFLGNNSEVRYGIEMLGFNTNFDFYNSVGRKIFQEEHTTELAAFLKYKITKGKFIIEPGFRAQYYASLSKLSPEPRLAIKFNATDILRFKFAGGLYSQNLIAANSDRDVVNLFYGFISGPDNLQNTFDGKEITHSLQKAQHLIFGVEYDGIKNISINVEGYYKRFSQLTNINRNKVFDDNEQYALVTDYLKKDFIIETGNAKGVDFSLKYDYRRIYLWAVYSLGYSDRFDGVIDYIPHFDRRHNVNLVFSYTLGAQLNWDFNLRWNFGSGFPFTKDQGNFEKLNFEQGINTDYTTASGDWGFQYASLNTGRLPAYHRLDVTLKRRFELGDNSTIEAFVGVTNVYDRDNIFYVERLTKKKIYQLPIMPSIGMNLKF